ncbi:hypothetical protein SUGI_0461710 [Cryptomeria japonica]|nr:hypothetical protein SUGI_0461710 [Cryptomeria japonica]
MEPKYEMMSWIYTVLLAWKKSLLSSLEKSRDLAAALETTCLNPTIEEAVIGDDVKCDQFLRWWDQFIEKGICLLNFSPGNVVERLVEKWNKLWNELLK